MLFSISRRLMMGIAVLCSLLSAAQNVGINNSNPQVALDIKGAIALRPDTIPQAGNPITIFNIGNISYIKFSSDNADPAQRYINLMPGKTGQQLIMEFSGAGAARMINGTNLSSGGKLLLASDMTFDDPSLIGLVFDGKNWKELYRQSKIRDEAALDSVLFTDPGSFTFKVPPGVTTLKLVLSGAGGWGGGATTNPLGHGGRGGLVSGDLTVTEGETLDIFIGDGGNGDNNGHRAGISSVKRGSTYLAVAAGGGNGSRNGGFGGDGGQSGGNGISGTSIFLSGSPGDGATSEQGGAGGMQGTQGDHGGAGGVINGGTNENYAFAQGEGWGGDGWYGGGASGTYDNIGLANGPYATGGGGGGSNYSGGLTGIIINNGNGSVAGTGDDSGNAGSIKIVW